MNYPGASAVQTSYLERVRPQLVRSEDVPRHVSHHQRQRYNIDPSGGVFRFGAYGIRTTDARRQLQALVGQFFAATVGQVLVAVVGRVVLFTTPVGRVFVATAI